jgi:DivIVA domain-containing protein
MEWFIAVVVVAILGVAAMAAAGGMGEMAKDPVRDTYRQDLPVDRQLNATDIQTLRFGVTLRGYAMNQVDDILDRLTREIAERDATIRQLSGGPDPVDEPLPHDDPNPYDEPIQQDALAADGDPTQPLPVVPADQGKRP